MVGDKIGLKNNTFSILLINYPSSFKKNKLAIFLFFFYLFVTMATMTITKKICMPLFFILASPTTPRPTTTPTTPGMKQISTTTSPFRNMHLLYEKG